MRSLDQVEGPRAVQRALDPGRSVARLLMAEAEFTARKRGCTYVHVNTWHDNDVAQAFCDVGGDELLRSGPVGGKPNASAAVPAKTVAVRPHT
jgi:hypothetical protein